MANPSRAKPTHVLVPVAILLLATLGVMAYIKKHEHIPREGQVGLQVGETIPDFEFKDLNGEITHISELGGKVVLVNFWATWCPPCIREMPALEKLHQTYKDRGLVVVGVNVDENPEEVLGPFVAKHGISFRNFIDRAAQLSDRFDVSGLPLTLVVDKERKLLLKQIGDEDWFDSSFRKQFEIWLGIDASSVESRTGT